MREYDPRIAYFVKVDIRVPEELHDYFDYAPIRKGNSILNGSMRKRGSASARFRV